MLIDTHAHLNFYAYKNNLSKVIKRALENNISIINVGSNYQTSKKAIEIAEEYEKEIYAAIGLHPIHAREKFEYQKFKDLVKSKKVVAIGETGLDYKQEYAFFKEKQKDIFFKHIELAQEFDLPIIFHSRMAHSDLISILDQETVVNNKKLTGVVHCFTGKWQEAEKYLEMGFYLGFNGIIFKFDLNETIKKVPLNKILIETDCPYLTPPPIVGINEPVFIKYVVQKIAEIKKLSYQEIVEKTTENAKNLFKI